VNIAFAGCFRHRERIPVTDGKWLFHHDVDAMGRAFFNRAAMIESVRVQNNSRWVSFRKHVGEGREVQCRIEMVTRGILVEKLTVRLGDTHDLNVLSFQGRIEEPGDVAVHQSHNTDSERRSGWRGHTDCGAEPG
jgi:hypothetical protein